MKMPLFKAALANQWLSMTIFAAVLVFYGMLIMTAFVSVQQTMSDPMVEGEGIKLTQMEEDPPGTERYNLTWDTEAGIAYHTAIGIKDLSSAAYFMDPAMIEGILNGSVGLDEVPGVTVLYNGTGTFVEFENVNGSVMFAVLLYPSNGGLSEAIMRGPLSSSELEMRSAFDEYLKDNPMMKGLFGDRMINFADLDGFIVIEYFSMWPLLFVIYLAIKASSSISKHVEDRSMDLLLATGYTRTRFLTEKMLVVAFNVLLLLICAWGGLVLGCIFIGKPIPILGITYGFLGSLPMTFAFIGIASLASSLIDEGGKTVGAVLGFTIFQYILQIVANIASWGDTLSYFTLFSYYDPFELVLDLSFDPLNVIVPTVLGILTLAGSYIIFNRRDIRN
ncbi:MAG: ABC transporter permease [Candidatus Thermoplasmatota archaeon]|nr:ABC transporter permease [Candidatus Thermoplasmatota archaeon]